MPNMVSNEIGGGTAFAILSGELLEEKAGALLFATNTAALRDIPAVSRNLVNASIDVAGLDVDDPRAGKFQATVDPVMARAVTALYFQIRDGANYPSKQILTGTVSVELSGDVVSGEIALEQTSSVGRGHWPALRAAIKDRRRCEWKCRRRRFSNLRPHAQTDMATYGSQLLDALEELAPELARVQPPARPRPPARELAPTTTTALHPWQREALEGLDGAAHRLVGMARENLVQRLVRLGLQDRVPADRVARVAAGIDHR
jgi:hypothetical protein